MTDLVLPQTRLAKILAYVPRILASKVNIVFLLALFVYLVVLPLSTIYVPSLNTQLELGNLTNVTSDIGACIAAGGTVTLLHHQKKNHLEKMMQAKIFHKEHLAAIQESRIDEG